MKKHWSMLLFTGCCLSLLTLQCSPKPPDTHVADEAAIRAINPSWFSAYNSGNVDAIVALYGEDAVLSAPGAPAGRGHAAIREILAKGIADGMALHAGSTTDAGVSGDLGWEWGTFTVSDKSDVTVDAGKYVTVYARKDGKWLIIRDIWNSDGPMQAAEMK